MHTYTWSDNKVRELIAAKVLHTSQLNTTVVAFKVLPLGNYAPMPTPSPPFKTILELALWNGLQSGRCSTPDVIKLNVHRMFHLDSSIGISEFRQWKGVITLKDTICNACMFRVSKHHRSISCRIL